MIAFSLIAVMVISFAAIRIFSKANPEMDSKSVHDYTVKNIDNEDVELSEYEGKVLLIVNVASKCGFTPQYEGMQALYEKYNDKGFEILAFPCNQFGAQEPGTADEIKSFCSTNFNVTFPLFAKIDVNGDNADPLYKYLKYQAPGAMGTAAIKWNFSKFLVGKDGKVIKRIPTQTKPIDIEADIEQLLK
jgi:glutathione peroxidase